MEKQERKRKFADAQKINDISESKFTNLVVDTEKFKGNISLLEILKVNKEVFVDEEQRCILAKDYKWLELYPENENYCITSIYNKNREIVEWYIDIAYKLGVENGVPYEEDLYLDVVIVPNGKIILLDEDELEEAYKNNVISKEEYDLAYKVANEIMENGKNRICDLLAFCDKYLEILENTNNK